MTRRERLEARLAKRQEWAESRDSKAGAAFNRAHSLTDGIPLGQPILVGHHSEKRHRRTLERADSAMRQGCESVDMAKEHRSKADGIERQLDNSIFSDDPDAPEAIKARIEELESLREEKRKLASAWRKAKKPLSTDLEGWKRVADILGRPQGHVWMIRAMRDCASEEGFLNRGPVPPYVLSNLGGNISRLRKRLVEIEWRAKLQAEAEAAPNGVVFRETEDHAYCSVRFAEYPGREIVASLKAAGFWYGGGAWGGNPANLPESVRALVTP